MTAATSGNFFGLKKLAVHLLAVSGIGVVVGGIAFGVLEGGRGALGFFSGAFVALFVIFFWALIVSQILASGVRAVFIFTLYFIFKLVLAGVMVYMALVRFGFSPIAFMVSFLFVLTAFGILGRRQAVSEENE